MSETPPAVLIRDARPSDAPLAAPLIHAAGPTLFNLLFGPETRDVVRLFDGLFRLPRNPFSYELGMVAEQNGQVVGLAMGGDAAARGRVGRRLFWLVTRLRGPFALLCQFPNALDIMACTSAPPPGAYYLSILAVAPERRGQGIGSALLREARRRAEASGSTCLALHTELDNRGAQSLYARHGYVEACRKATKRAASRGVAGFVAMQCALGPQV